MGGYFLSYYFFSPRFRDFLGCLVQVEDFEVRIVDDYTVLEVSNSRLELGVFSLYLAAQFSEHKIAVCYDEGDRNENQERNDRKERRRKIKVYSENNHRKSENHKE